MRVTLPHEPYQTLRGFFDSALGKHTRKRFLGNLDSGKQQRAEAPLHHEDPEPAGVPPSTAAASPRRQRTLKEQRAEINELKAMVTSLESRLADSEKHLHEAREHTVKWMYYHTEVARDLAVIAGHIHPGLTLSSHPASQALLKIQGVLDENPHKAALKLVADTLMEVLIQTRGSGRLY
jgi:hypothetical protein